MLIVNPAPLAGKGQNLERQAIRIHVVHPARLDPRGDVSFAITPRCHIFRSPSMAMWSSSQDRAIGTFCLSPEGYRSITRYSESDACMGCRAKDVVLFIQRKFVIHGRIGDSRVTIGPIVVLVRVNLVTLIAINKAVIGMISPKWGIRALLLASICFSSMARVADGSSIRLEDDDRQATIERLIDDLGADDFSAREVATRELIRIGAPALGLLDEAATHPDREVRFRVQRAATTIRKNDLQSRIGRFNRGEMLEGEEALPGWETFQSVVGDESKARRLFIEIQKVEYSLMDIEGHDPEDIANSVTRRATQLYSAFRDPNERVNPASVAGLLLLAGKEDVEIDDQTYMSIYYICSNAGFYDAIKQGRDQQMLRQLMAKWLVKARPTMAYQALVLAMRFDVAEGLKLAVDTLNDAGNLGTLEKRYAIQTVAKFGNSEHIEVLAAYLDDETRISSRLIGENSLVTQIRDLALAASIHLAGQKVKDFGFVNATRHDDFVFLETSLGFLDEESRGEARQQWTTFQAQENTREDG